MSLSSSDAGTPLSPDAGQAPDAGSLCPTTHARVGWYADLSTFAHGVRGRVTITDDCTLTFTNFSYDGNGIDVRTYGAIGGLYTQGFAIGPQLYRPGNPYNNTSLVMTLPTGKSMSDLDGVSIWCVAAKVSFGDGLFRAP